MKCLKTYQIEKPDEFWFSAKYYHYWYILTQKFRIKSKQTEKVLRFVASSGEQEFT